MRKTIAILILATLLPACAKRTGQIPAPEPRSAEEATAQVTQGSQAAAKEVPEFDRSSRPEFEKVMQVVVVITLSLAVAAGLAYLSYVVMPDLIHF